MDALIKEAPEGSLALSAMEGQDEKAPTENQKAELLLTPFLFLH